MSICRNSFLLLNCSLKIVSIMAIAAQFELVKLKKKQLFQSITILLSTMFGVESESFTSVIETGYLMMYASVSDLLQPSIMKSGRHYCPCKNL